MPAPGPARQAPGVPPLPSSGEALVGIDGSGSMLGFLGSGSGEWLSMLQALDRKSVV